MNNDLISRQAAIETVRKAQSIGQAHRMLAQLPSAQSEYERVSAENVAVRIAPTILTSAVWLCGILKELEKAGYVICRRMT